MNAEAIASPIPILVSVDWGTTSLRCALVASDGTTLEQTKAARGILHTNGQSFAAILLDAIGPFEQRFTDGESVPVLLSGMIGSRQGWHEAPYLRCPASPQDLARSLLRVDTKQTPLAGCDVRIVPGMDVTEQAAPDALPDVMRGEETQVLGALIGAELQDGVFVLPGTHSKWVTVEAGTIVGFRTFMTGEVYAALLNATILGQLAEGDEHDDDSYALGVRTAARLADRAGPGELLNMIFTARSRVLHDELKDTAVPSYLSGLLIGAEIASGAGRSINTSRTSAGSAFTVCIIGDETLQKRYMQAASIMGGTINPAVDNPVAKAHLAIAGLAGMTAQRPIGEPNSAQ